MSPLISTLVCVIAMASSLCVKTIPDIDQLPVTAVHRIYEDSQGYMWYGTVEGLCRDDGYNIVAFRPTSRMGSQNTKSPVTSILESPTGDMWFGTDDGCYMIKMPGGYVVPINHERCRNVRTEVIGVGQEGEMYVSVRGNLLRFRPDGTFMGANELPHPVTLSKMSRTSDGKIWFSGWGVPILNLDKATGELREVPQSPPVTTHTIARDGKKIWLATDKGEIYLYNPDATGADRMCVLAKHPDDEGILHMVQDDRYGDLWVTTEVSLRRYVCGKDGLLTNVDIDEMPHESMMLNEIIKDHKGNLWVSAFDRSSFCIDLHSNLPSHNKLEQINKRFGAQASVIAMAPGKGDDIWFAHERKGLCHYNSMNNDVVYFKDCSSVSHLPLGSIEEMTRSGVGSEVWVTPRGSRTLYGLRHEKGAIIMSDSLDLSGMTRSYINKLWENGSGILWIGTGDFLFSYNTADKSLKLVGDSIGKVSDIRESALGHVWIGTEDKGLWQLSDKGELKRWQLTDRYSIVSISPTSDGNVWFATDDGEVYRFSPKEGVVSSPKFDVPSGRCAISHVHVDDYGHVWLICNQIIMEFNPANGASHTYLTSDAGMPWRILPTSFYVDDDGAIFVGGIPGISRLTPSGRLGYEPQDIKPVVSDVKVGGKSILIGDSTGINSSREIYLNPDDAYIDISFTTLNHLYADKTKYAYRLKGFDKEWIALEPGENVASYTRLPSGTFVLEVRATDDNDQWGTAVATLKIHRAPAFFETWWFRTIIILVIILVMGAAVVAYIRSIKKKNEEIWEDSATMIKMRDYIKSTDDNSDPQYEEMDRILMQKIDSVIESNLSDIGFSVESLAREVGMSRSTLTRKMKIATGQTPLDYIRGVKMRHAKAMLSDKGRNVSDVAYALGYDNRKYFTSCFKNAFGMTPTDFQKSVVKDASVKDVSNAEAEVSFESKEG